MDTKFITIIFLYCFIKQEFVSMSTTDTATSSLSTASTMSETTTTFGPSENASEHTTNVTDSSSPSTALCQSGPKTSTEQSPTSPSTMSCPLVTTKSCKCSDEDKSMLPLAVVLSFIGGMLVVIIPLCAMKMYRQRKCCFAEKEEPPKDKWHNASTKITDKVIRMHTLERLNEIDIIKSSSYDSEAKPQRADEDAQNHSHENGGAINHKESNIKLAREEDPNRDMNDSLTVTLRSETPKEVQAIPIVKVEDIDNCELKTETEKKTISSEYPKFPEETHTIPEDTMVKKQTDSHNIHAVDEIINFEVFEYERESTVSDIYPHDCLVVENENFRNSQQTVGCQ